MYENNHDDIVLGYEPESIGRYTSKAFGWMFLGLLVTFIVSMLVVGNEPLINFLLYNMMFVYALMIGELILVWSLSKNIQKMSVFNAKSMFFLYAALNGVTLSFIFIIYSISLLVYVFAITALFFGIMALYGYVTKTDLTGIGKILTFGLFFLIGFYILSMFLNLSQYETIFGFIGIAIFLGLTAYDTQKIKGYYEHFSGNPDMLKKASIFSALQLYLDFINLFLFMLRILGRRR